MNDNYKNFLEAKIYLENRDGAINYANDLRRKYPEYVGILNFADIYRRIVNYRVKKYGTSRIGYSCWDDPTIYQMTKNAYHRKLNRKRRLKK